MKTKVCFRCNIEKPLSEFYKHKRMGDGHLNKCKDCTKGDSKKRHYNKYKDIEFVEKERKRAKERYRRLGYKDKQKQWDKDKYWKQDSLYKGMSSKLRRLGLLNDGDTAHHYDYNKLNEVFVINLFKHKHIHTLLDFCDESLCFIDRSNGELLNTIELNCNFLDKHGIEYNFVKV